MEAPSIVGSSEELLSPGVDFFVSSLCSLNALIARTKRVIRRIHMSTPNSEYDGGRTFGFSGIDVIYTNMSVCANTI